jgi:regulatory protein
VRKAKEATPAYLERVALWYLERYGGTESRVRRALEKRVRRSVEELGTDAEEGRAAVDEVLERLRRGGWLDDRRFAEARARTLRQRGLPARAIRQKLRQSGVATETCDAVLAASPVDDLEAARTFVRKKRLGPHRRKPPVDPARARHRDLGRLARAGFSYGVAKAVLDE